MKRVTLRGGSIALIDDQDFKIVSQYKWHLTSRGYARRTTRENRSLYMHRLILNPPDDMDVDHINHNPLDNRRANLRVATTSQNLANTQKYACNKSGYKGVSWDKGKHTWVAQITINRRVYHLGRSKHDKIKLAKLYNERAIKAFGEFAVLNEI